MRFPIEALSAPLALAVLFLAGCDARQAASCTQIQVAACALREHCGGTSASVCEVERAGLSSGSCSTSLDDGTTCVNAINAVLAGTCTTLPTDLPCPGFLATAGQSCEIDRECSGTLPCIGGRCGGGSVGGEEGGGGRDTRYRICETVADCGQGDLCEKPIARATSVCTRSCTSASQCPSPTNGAAALCNPLYLPKPDNSASCFAGCRSDAECAVGMVCADGTACFPAE